MSVPPSLMIKLGRFDSAYLIMSLYWNGRGWVKLESRNSSMKVFAKSSMSSGRKTLRMQKRRTTLLTRRWTAYASPSSRAVAVS